MRRVMKKAVTLAATVMLAFTATATTNTTQVQAQAGNPNARYVSFTPDDGHVKPIGRTYKNLYGKRWICNTASGVEFTFTGDYASITLEGDDMATAPYEEWLSDKARVAIYVNDVLVRDTCLTEEEHTYEIFNSDEEEEVKVKVLKLSENSLANVAIDWITIHSQETIHPTPEKTRKIEFIGDSLSNGYGVEESDYNGHFTTATENGTKTCDYKTAQALDADYSVFAISGFGVISGVTQDESKDSYGCVPNFYDKVGYSTSNFADGTNPGYVDWDFSRFQPDVVVINLGSNDYSYVKDYADRKQEFVQGYVDFLKHIRLRNQNAKIICAYGMYEDRMFPLMEQAFDRYHQETGDYNTGIVRLDLQTESDGINLHGHPSETTYTKAANKLTAYIRQQMNWY